jgi:hypothetical protein
MHTGPPATSDRRPRRRRPGLANATTGRSPQRRNAPLQVSRQPDLDAYPELRATIWPLRVSLRISCLPRRGARPAAFQYNSNAFHFDTEIIIQLMLAGCRIQEVPIPTDYGDEICRVNGVRYAIDVVLATLASRFHCLGILYDRKFDIDGPGNLHYRLKLGYRSSQRLGERSPYPHHALHSEATLLKTATAMF